jgi:hypothetical protein
MRWTSRILFVYRVIEYCVELYHHRQTLQNNNDNNNNVRNCNYFPVEWISHFLIPSIQLCLVTFLLWTESKLSSFSSSDYAELPCSLLRSNKCKLITKPKYHANNKCSRSITNGNIGRQRNINNNDFSYSNFVDCSTGNHEIRSLEVVDENGDEEYADTDD